MTGVQLSPEVSRGVAFLDLYKPDWRSKIDRGKLNLGSTSDCILGQLYGSYYKGAEALGIPPGNYREAARALGFFANDFVNYEQLTAEWRLALAYSA